MIAMTGRWEWLLVPLALTERLLFPPVEVARVAVAIAIAGIILVSWLRVRSARSLGSPPSLVTER